MKSIIQSSDCCYFCGTTYNLHTHHIFGASNRKNSDKYKLTVRLCGYHHNLGGNGKCVHQCREMDLQLKQLAQSKFEETRSRDEFIKIFGKSWL